MAKPVVEVRLSAARGDYAVRVVRAAAQEWLRTLGYGEVSLSIVPDGEMRQLNRRFRGKDKPTDVLSFPLQEGRRHLGDVVISLDTARRQAAEGGWPLSVELRRLLAHGLLHCAGHDHETPRDAQRMQRAERRLLGARGMV
ncbi:MAG TPA: rRNA maturation RNase YbeY [Myxococcales bacterium]|jgi:probable rRNA maturation factor